MFSEGKVVSNSHFTLRFVSVSVEGVAQVKAAFLVRKNFGNAVKRNRIKRIMREIYRINKQDVVIFSSNKKLDVNLAFLVRTSGISGLTFTQVEAAMKELMLKVIQFHEIHSDSSH